MPGRARTAGARLTGRARRPPGVAVGARRGPAPRRRSSAGPGPGVMPRALDRGLLVNAVAPTPSASHRRCSSATSELDEGVGHPRRRAASEERSPGDGRPMEPSPSPAQLPRGRRPRPRWPGTLLRAQAWSAPAASRRARRPGRRHALREAVGPHPHLHRDGRRRPSAAIPSTSAQPRSASASARPPRTSPAPSPATTRSSAPASSTTPPSRAWPLRSTERLDMPVVNLLSDRAHPCQALADLLTLRELFGGVDGRARRLHRRRQQRRRLPRLRAALCGLELPIASPRGYTLEPTSSASGPATSAGRSSSSPTDPTAGGHGRRRRLHRRVDLDGPGGRAGRPPGRVRRVHVDEDAGELAAARRRRVALPARPPRRGDQRRGDRRPPVRGVAPGRQPDARHAGRCWPGSRGERG